MPYSGAGAAARVKDFPPRLSLEKKLFLSPRSSLSENFERLSSRSSSDRTGLCSFENPSERLLKFPSRDGRSDESSRFGRPYDLLSRGGFEKSSESPRERKGFFESSRSSRLRVNGFSSREEKPEPSDRFLKFPLREGLSLKASFRSYDLRGFESSQSLREREENGFSFLDENPEPSERFLKFPVRVGFSDESSFERPNDLPPRGDLKSFESLREDLNGFLESPRVERESEREEVERAPLRPAGLLRPLLPSLELSRLGI